MVSDTKFAQNIFEEKKKIYIYIIYSIEYSSAIKKSETMPFAATWIDLEIIIPSEVSQTKTNII